MKPLVSILIPTYDRPESLLKSVTSALLQSYNNIEVIVSDNKSLSTVDKELGKLEDSRIIYSKNETNIGPVLNWKKALTLARGKYCILLPDDDFFINPFYIEEVVFIAESKRVNLVITNCVIGYPTHSFIASSNYIGLIDGKMFLRDFWGKYHIPTISNLFNRELALAVNAFHSNEILYSDIELWFKILIHEKDIYCYHYPSIYYNFHGGNIVTTMTQTALIENASFINNALSSKVSDQDIYRLVCRYLEQIAPRCKKVSRSFIKSIFVQNGFKKGYKLLYWKYKKQRMQSY